MTLAGFTVEVAVLGLGLGLCFSLVCYLVTNLSPGGMITPGWLAITLVEDAVAVAVIIGVAGLTWAGTVALQRVVILFGKRLFATVVLLGVLLQVTLTLLQLRGHTLPATQQTLGFIVPGLIAYQLVRQPSLPTLVATASVTAVASVVLLVGNLLHLLPQ
jgi:gamma-polyglutamate biosynthesis protein CapC